MTPRQRLGRYELLEPLGEGGMGAVWLARLSGTAGFEKLCIVKTVLPSIAKDAQFVSRFLHEGKLLTQLQHSNIAQVFDMGDEGGTLYLALEYVAGVDVARLMTSVQHQQRALPLSIALYLVHQAAEGLASAHRKTDVGGTSLGIVHRDISPQNLMVSYEGEVKVIDFGIAKSMARSVSTAAPTVMGKLGYMAPEQAKGELVDHRADQYALGIVLWELLANQPYVPRGTVTEMVAAMTHATPKPVIPLRPEVPPSLEVAIQRALSPSPDARFPTTDDFARALMESLTRLSALPSKLDVGEFVKANCADAYRSNRDLLTRISTVRELPTPASIPSTSGAPVALPLTKTASSSLGANMTTAQHAASAFPVPKRGARRLMVLAAITGTAVVAWLLVRGPSSPAPSSLADKPPVAPLPKVQLEGPPVAKPAATDEKVLGTIPPAVDVVQGKVGEVVESKQVTEIFVDDGKTYVRAGVNEGLVVGATLVITGPPVEGKRLKVGTATVMEVFPTMARISLDAAANEAVAPRFAALAITSAKDAGASGQAEKLPAATRTSPRGAMKGVIQLQTTPVWSVFLQNTSKFTWTQCTLFAPGQRRFAFASLIPQGRREFPVGLFVFDATVPQLNNEVQVGCKEGTIRISAQ